VTAARMMAATTGAANNKKRTISMMAPQAVDRMTSAAIQPIAMAGAAVLPEGWSGRIEMSATRRPSVAPVEFAPDVCVKADGWPRHKGGERPGG
jgi:hypothetical protein